MSFVDYFDHDKLGAALKAMFDILDVSHVAPAHGNPVAAAYIDDYADDVMRALRKPNAM